MPEKVTSLNGLKVTLEYGSYNLVRIIYLMLNHVDTLAFPITLKIGLFSDIHHINGTPHMGRSLRSF